MSDPESDAPEPLEAFYQNHHESASRHADDNKQASWMTSVIVRFCERFDAPYEEEQ